MRKSLKGFTLIELLIVVAIIGILAAIIVANFQTALVKSKVARSQADIKTMINAVMQYRIEWNDLPNMFKQGEGTTSLVAPVHITDLYQLTTPVSYVNIGQGVSPFSWEHGYWFYNWTPLREINQAPVKMFWNRTDSPEEVRWMVSTLGPYTLEFGYDPISGGVVRGQTILWYDYNITNGIMSRGIIQQHGN
ncbi:prepilin-type N-terminal cleavage/methylation domain-containing protein [bacterium]|nr:prepilin-type N-terminal cleavage/methylation domain-containing protein [bacterium]